MSRDLSFWRTSTEVEADNRATYVALSNAKHLTYVDEIPAAKITAAFKDAFQDWENDGSGFYENGRESFQLMITKQFVRADCYDMTKRSMNTIIDIMLEYGCPLYDSTIDVRFDGK